MLGIELCPMRRHHIAARNYGVSGGVRTPFSVTWSWFGRLHAPQVRKTWGPWASRALPGSAERSAPSTPPSLRSGRLRSNAVLKKFPGGEQEGETVERNCGGEKLWTPMDRLSVERTSCRVVEGNSAMETRVRETRETVQGKQWKPMNLLTVEEARSRLVEDRVMMGVQLRCPRAPGQNRSHQRLGVPRQGRPPRDSTCRFGSVQTYKARM